MEITPHLVDEIKKKLKELKLTLSQVSNIAGFNDLRKPILSASTLSSIQTGKQKKMNDEAFRVLADILNIDLSKYLSELQIVRIAFEPSCYAAPIITALVNDNSNSPLPFEQLSFSCYEKNNHPEMISTYNEFPPLDPIERIKTNTADSNIEDTNGDHIQIFTANETLTLLRKNKVDIAFLPVLATAETPGIVRIARCMNSVKGGLYLFVIEKKYSKEESYLESSFLRDGEFDYEKLKTIKRILRQTDEEYQKYKDKTDENSAQRLENLNKRCCFYFPQNTIAEVVIERMLFGNTAYEKHALEIRNMTKFQNDIIEKVEYFFNTNSQAKYFIFVGSDIMIDRLYKNFPNHILQRGDETYAGRYFDIYRFTKPSYPFIPISYDCVTLESNYEYLLKHRALHSLLSLLSQGVKKLNLVKNKKGNSVYRQIKEFLNMRYETVENILNRINWDLLIYPEIFDKDLKN